MIILILEFCFVQNIARGYFTQNIQMWNKVRRVKTDWTKSYKKINTTKLFLTDNFMVQLIHNIFFIGLHLNCSLIYFLMSMIWISWWNSLISGYWGLLETNAGNVHWRWFKEKKWIDKQSKYSLTFWNYRGKRPQYNSDKWSYAFISVLSSSI
jgi:hypothetical protein